MLYDPLTDKVHCAGCNRWISLRGSTYSVYTQRRCLAQDHIVGYEHDLPEIFGDEEDE